MDYKKALKFYPDFPIDGVNFVDILPYLQDKEVFKSLIDDLGALCATPNIVAPEARGFLFTAPLLYNGMAENVIPVRKKGKLPRETVSQKYDLEYGQAEVEIHKDAVKSGQKVVIVDDLIATGGSAEAAVKLVERLGGKVVKMVFVMELAGLEGRKTLAGYDVESLIVYPGK